MSANLKSYEEMDLKYNLKVLWSFLKKYKAIFFGIIILLFLSEIVSFFDNFVFKYLVDKATLFSKDQLAAELFSKIILFSVLINLSTLSLALAIRSASLSTSKLPSSTF